MTFFFTTSDGTRIAYTKLGNGPAVVFLHGWMCNRGFWTDQILALSRHYTCIAVDFRGHGSSSLPEAPCRMAALANDIHELIAYMEISDGVLVGHSMGGMVAQMIASQAPAWMSALVLVTTIAADTSDQLISKRIAQGAESSPFIQAFDDHFPGWFHEDTDPAFVAHTRDEMLRTPDSVALDLVRDYWRFGLTAKLPHVTVPTLVIGGRADNSSPASQAHLLADAIPRALLRVIDCGHFPMIERSEELTGILADFLESNLQPPSRIERDLLGDVPVPEAALYGAQTQRAVENFPLAGEKCIGDYPAFVDALVLIKLAAAETNHKTGDLEADVAEAIVEAARRLLVSPRYDQFPVHRCHGGGGTSANMNVNEVLANVAEQSRGGRPGQYRQVHPNNHVNCNQSTNDVFPTACRMAVIMQWPLLAQALDLLARAWRDKADQAGQRPRLARTCLQDAVETTWADLFIAYAAGIERHRSRLEEAVDRLHAVNLGGSIVGRDVDTSDAYRREIVAALRRASGDEDYIRAANLYDAAQSMDDLVAVSGGLDILARTLIKICKDLRLLASGPEGGFGELRLPAAQPGSSIMPGKVNPVIPEFVILAGLQVKGNHAACAGALDHGELDLNVWESAVVFNILDSFERLTAAIQTLIERCIQGLGVSARRSRAHARSVIPLLTRLAREHGYARISKLCSESGGDLKKLKQDLQDQGLLPANG
jgi:aspartate ammonia-lyase